MTATRKCEMLFLYHQVSVLHHCPLDSGLPSASAGTRHSIPLDLFAFGD
jgi:hypothetical protein